MTRIETIVRSINREFVPQFEERLRAVLAEQDREWLIDQIVRLTLDAHSLEEIDRRVVVEAKARARAERLSRVRELRLDRQSLETFLGELSGTTREDLIAAGHLAADAPEKGTALLTRAHRRSQARPCWSTPRTSCSPCSSAMPRRTRRSSASSRSC